jgi:hypothetical protein
MSSALLLRVVRYRPGTLPPAGYHPRRPGQDLFLPGVMNQLVQAWGEAMPQREQYSPLAAGMYTELGGLNKWCHIWPYASFAERDRIRGETRQAGVWPPQGSWRQSMIKQENKVLIPAAFSPMH